MAPITYYYLFSLILVAGVVLWLIISLSIKLNSEIVFGKISTEGTPRHDRLFRAASNKNILLLSASLFALLANLAVSVITVLSQESSDKYILLVGGPIVVFIGLLIIILKIRRDLQALPPEDGSNTGYAHKRENKDDSRLS